MRAQAMRPAVGWGRGPLARGRLGKLLAEAGLERIEWLEPEATGFHQPIVAARAP